MIHPFRAQKLRAGRNCVSRNPGIAVLALIMTSLACSVFVGGPDLPEPPPAPSGDPLQELGQQLEQAVAESATSGRLVLHISQEQVTAYLASQLTTQDPPLLTEPRVVLDDQKMILYGRAQSGMIEANVMVATEFTIDEAGQPRILISDAQLGPLPMPPALQAAIAAAIDEARTGSIGPAAIGFRLESIDIVDGEMT